ncbi:MarR family winged helix-turn-helix transcriptional regulator [Tenggerimyces flavus]|uniref:MarR family winged helix-turn-helix transcriptional regulator n=1 Tax=Tenggerimyces flavus TaxID=1708749 RepID=A0ABV7YAF2_9ACTN|nr:hypothetical protein [Tenggerimyces flavus]MBM7788971.1 DNA-binding MarR family transcriptional regulator [Tenggerimyces flavus]
MTPPLTGQDIAEANGAVNALLDHQLQGTGVTARQFVILRVIAVRGPWSRHALEEFLVSQRQLTLDANGAAAELDTLAAKGLVTEAELTTAGEAEYERLQAVANATAAELYAEFAPEELATTRSVLRRVIERAQQLSAV